MYEHSASIPVLLNDFEQIKFYCIKKDWKFICKLWFMSFLVKIKTYIYELSVQSFKLRYTVKVL